MLQYESEPSEYFPVAIARGLASVVPSTPAMSKPVCFSPKAFGTPDAKDALGPLTIERRKPAPSEVEIKILYCGVCHSDLHFARNEWTSRCIPPWRATRLSVP